MCIKMYVYILRRVHVVSMMYYVYIMCIAYIIVWQGILHVCMQQDSSMTGRQVMTEMLFENLECKALDCQMRNIFHLHFMQLFHSAMKAAG